MNYEPTVTPFSARFTRSAVGEDGDIPGQRTTNHPPERVVLLAVLVQPVSDISFATVCLITLHCTASGCDRPVPVPS
jgi:hypothetical protein